MLSIALLLAVEAVAVSAADPNSAPPWPQKGDTIYVSATLTHVNAQLTIMLPLLTGGSSTPSISELAACMPLKLTKAQGAKQKWITMDPAGGGQFLDGPWLSRMHRAESECREHLKAQGEPTVIHSNWKHVIVDPNAPVPPPEEAKVRKSRPIDAGHDPAP